MYDQQQLFDFGGRQFCAGLFWQTVANSRDWKKEARAQAEIQFKDMDLVSFCQLKDPYGVPQIGFASAEGGAKRGAISIAATVARAVTERANHSSWIGIFQLEEDYFVFVAVLKDAILPEGDSAGNKADVLERFGQEFGQSSQWDAIYAPASFDIPNSEEIALPKLLGLAGATLRLKKPSKLEPVRSDFVTKKNIVMVSLALLAMAAAYVVVNRDDLPFLKETVHQQIVQQLPPVTKEPERIMLPLPWKTQPEPAQVALMCLEALQALPVSPGGWERESVQCGQQGVKFTWVRGASNVRFILDALPDVQFDPAPNQQVAPGQHPMPDGNRASYTLTRQLPPPYEEEVVANMVQARLALLAIVQGIGLQGAFTDYPEGEKKNAAGQIEVKSWKNLNFVLTGRLAPWDFVALASHIHGLRLRGATLVGDQWKLEGDIYGK